MLIFETSFFFVIIQGIWKTIRVSFAFFVEPILFFSPWPFTVWSRRLHTFPKVIRPSTESKDAPQRRSRDGFRANVLFVAMFGYPGNPETNILQPENSPNKKEKQSFSGAMLPKNQLYME